MKANKQINMWNRDFESIKTWKNKLNKTNIWRQDQKLINKIRVFGQVHAHAWTSLRAHNQAYLRRQDYAYTSFYPETLET